MTPDELSFIVLGLVEVFAGVLLLTSAAPIARWTAWEVEAIDQAIWPSACQSPSPIHVVSAGSHGRGDGHVLNHRVFGGGPRRVCGAIRQLLEFIRRGRRGRI